VSAPAGGPGGGAFPDPPKGSPGGIRSAARSLASAGRDLEEVATGLSGATGALEADWNGDAAGSYRVAAQGLTSVARAAQQTFADCARAVDEYAHALEHAQQQIAKLKVAYADAKTREATAQGQAQRLAGQLLSAHPNAVSGLESRIATAGGDAQSAGGDATHIAERARQVLEEFRREQSRASAVLSGQRVSRGATVAGWFAGPGLAPAAGVGNGLSPGFGVPLGGLAAFNGVVAVGDPWNSAIPGFGIYWDAKHGAAQPTNDLTNLILLAAGGLGPTAARGLALAARGLAEGAGRKLVLTGGREIVDAAEAQAQREAQAVLSSTTRSRTAAITASGRNAAVKAQAQVDAAQGRSLKNLTDLARNAGVPVPQGTADVLGHLAEYQGVYRYYAAAKLLRLQTTLEASGTRAAMRAAELVNRAIRSLAR